MDTDGIIFQTENQVLGRSQTLHYLAKPDIFRIEREHMASVWTPPRLHHTGLSERVENLCQVGFRDHSSASDFTRSQGSALAMYRQINQRSHSVIHLYWYLHVSTPTKATGESGIYSVETVFLLPLSMADARVCNGNVAHFILVG